MVAKDWKNYFETNYQNALGLLSKLWNVKLFGTTAAGDVAELEVNNDGNLIVGQPSDAYTLAYTGDRLDTVTRTSDSKVITLGYTGDNLTSVSDWT